MLNVEWILSNSTLNTHQSPSEMKQRFLNILFWSVISAAFIGPGTVTTAASAGAEYGYTLVWALVFSTVACVVLQEAASRLTLASGQNLGEAIRGRFNRSLPGKMLIWLVLGSILLGCAAYEAGNILGAVAGTALIFDLNTSVVALLTGGMAALLLWFGSIRQVAQVLGIIVAVMGLSFLTTAAVIGPDIGALLTGSLIPRVPDGSELLVIGLIGTTVVPYNLFLGSGLRHSQNLKEMRLSLATAIVLGGIVSVGVLVVGSSISDSFTYEALARELQQRLGSWAGLFFGTGLFAAGLSSALTAPLAAAVTARSMLNKNTPGSPDGSGWEAKQAKFRLTWGVVLGVGILFGVLQVQPIPAIILAQALNGIILPVTAVVLLIMVNDSALLRPDTINSHPYNLLMGLIVLATLVIGLVNLGKALTRSLSVSMPPEETIILSALVVSLLLCWPLFTILKKYRGR